MTRDSEANLTVLQSRALAARGEAEMQSVRDEIGQAIESSLKSHNAADASAYASLLASTFAISGEQERALAEYRRAAELDPINISNRLTTARQLVRMHRSDEAIGICRDVLTISDLDASDRHEALATLGKAFLPSDRDEARRQLEEAQAVAEVADLPTILWDQMLAEDIARAGDPTGLRYLLALRSRALSKGDQGVIATVDDTLRGLERQ